MLDSLNVSRISPKYLQLSLALIVSIIVIHELIHHVNTSYQFSPLKTMQIVKSDVDQCNQFKATLTEVRRNVNQLARLGQINRILKVLLVGSFNEDCKCKSPCNSLDLVSMRLALGMKKAGVDVTIYMDGAQSKNSCIDKDIRAMLTSNLQRNPITTSYSGEYDLVLFARISPIIGKLLPLAKFSGLYTPVDTTSMNKDSRYIHSQDSSKLHIDTHTFLKNYMDFIFCPSSMQMLAWSSMYSEYNEELGKLYGIGPEIRQVPEGERKYTVLHNSIDLATNFNSSWSKGLRDGKMFTIGFTGGWGGPRKGIMQLVEAFTLAFPLNDPRPVKLHLRLTYANGKLDIKTWGWDVYQRFHHDKRIIFEVAGDGSSHEVKKFYRSLDVYMSLGQFEGFGLPPLEAMMEGATIILHNWSGMMDYCIEPSCYKVHSNFARNDPQFPNDGVWMVADIDHAAKQLNLVYDLYISETLPTAGEYSRHCVVNSFAGEDIASSIFSEDALNFNAVGCFKSKLPVAKSGTILIDSILEPFTVSQCASAARASNNRFFTSLAGACIGFATLKSQRDEWEFVSDVYNQESSYYESRIKTPYFCWQPAFPVFEVTLNFPSILVSRPPITVDAKERYKNLLFASRVGMEQVQTKEFRPLTRNYLQNRPLVKSKNLQTSSKFEIFFGNSWKHLKQKHAQFLDAHSSIQQFAHSLVALESWDLYDLFFPTLAYECSAKVAYGFGNDQAKISCGALDAAVDNQEDCVIFSLGSNNHFEFEIDVLKLTDCKVHTFDCTVDMNILKIPETEKNTMFYHNWCIAAQDAMMDNRQFYSINTIMQKLSLKNIDYLKMDIEGYEWDCFRSFLEGPVENLPKQIALELHFDTDKDSIDDVAALSKDLHQAGYAAVHVEPNFNCGGCAELVLIKIY